MAAFFLDCDLLFFNDKRVLNFFSQLTQAWREHPKKELARSSTGGTSAALQTIVLL